MHSNREKLPSLLELSHHGWSSLYAEDIGGKRVKRVDPWENSDKISAKLVGDKIEVSFVKFSRFGAKSKIAFVHHGGPFGRINEGWRYFFRPSDLSVILMKQPVFDGFSRFDFEQNINRLTLQNLSLETHWVRRALTTQPVLSVGSSWGGTVALAYAAIYPEEVGGVVVSSPLVPMSRSLDYIVSREGGFGGNSLLFEYFMEPIKGNRLSTGREVFAAYAELFESVTDVGQVAKRFSSIFYAILGDVDRPVHPDKIPGDAISIERARSFAALGSLKHPFGLDEQSFLGGLKALRNSSVPVAIICGNSERTMDPKDRDKISSIVGNGSFTTVPGGHSSPEMKKRLGEVLHRFQK